MRVGVDCDGVLSAFQEEFVSYLATLTGFEHCTLETMDPTWSFYKGWNMPTEEFIKHFHGGVDAGHIFSKAEPLPGAVEATHKLHEAGHSVHIVTDCNMGLSRAGVSQRARVTWLAKHEFYFDSITFTADKTSVPTDAFIDDKIENYIDLAWTIGSGAHLLDRPWNQTSSPVWETIDLGSRIPRDYVDAHRVKDITEFVDILTKEKVHG